MKRNCWEFKKCGRQPGGFKSMELGVCPAAANESLDGVHEGANAGRSCWVVAGTLCGGEVQGTYAKKSSNCRQCDFYLMVAGEEGEKFQNSFALLTVMR